MAELERDGRGQGGYPLDYYIKASDNPFITDYILKPEFEFKRIDAPNNTDSFLVFDTNIRRYVCNEGCQKAIEEKITIPLTNLRMELTQGSQKLANYFSEQAKKTFTIPEPVKVEIQPIDNTKPVINPIDEAKKNFNPTSLLILGGIAAALVLKN